MNQYKAVLLLTVILQVNCDWLKIVFNLWESSVYSFKFICIWGNSGAANDYSFNIILFDLRKSILSSSVHLSKTERKDHWECSHGLGIVLLGI